MMRPQVLESRDDLSILTAAVKAAGLDDTLDDPKAVLTVFAPVDKGAAAWRGGVACARCVCLTRRARAAFEELLERLKMTKEQLLSNKARKRVAHTLPCRAAPDGCAAAPQILLVRVLDYHVVPGVAAKADDLCDGQKLATMARARVASLRTPRINAPEPSARRC
jgi:uncharacterized surface protein with fasciclin (FAS1) repeats